MTTTPDATPRKQTPRGMRTRGQLLKAARRVFERDGFLASRISDIADLAGVAHGTFYTHYDSKEEIFRELLLSVVHDEMLRGPSPAATDEVARSPRESIERANRRYLAAYQANAQLMVIWEQAATINDMFNDMRTESRRQFADRVARSIRDLQEQGIADPAVDPEYAAVALGAMVSRFAYMWFAGNEVFDFEKAVEQLTRLWCNSLGLPLD